MDQFSASHYCYCAPAHNLCLAADEMIFKESIRKVAEEPVFILSFITLCCSSQKPRWPIAGMQLTCQVISYCRPEASPDRIFRDAFKGLDLENTRLMRLLADAKLDKAILYRWPGEAAGACCAVRRTLWCDRLLVRSDDGWSHPQVPERDR